MVKFWKSTESYDYQWYKRYKPYAFVTILCFDSLITALWPGLNFNMKCLMSFSLTRTHHHKCNARELNKTRSFIFSFSEFSISVITLIAYEKQSALFCCTNRQLVPKKIRHRMSHKTSIDIKGKKSEPNSEIARFPCYQLLLSFHFRANKRKKTQNKNFLTSHKRTWILFSKLSSFYFIHPQKVLPINNQHC